MISERMFEKRLKLYNPFSKFRGRSECKLSNARSFDIVSVEITTMLNTLSTPEEPLVISGESSDPFPPEFVDLIEPVGVHDTSYSDVNISGEEIIKNLHEFDFGLKKFCSSKNKRHLNILSLL